MFDIQKKSIIVFLLSLGLFLVFSNVSNADFQSGTFVRCNFEAKLTIAPTNGQPTTPVQLISEFRWVTGSDPACLIEDLNRQFFYEFENTGTVALGPEIGFSASVLNQWERYVLSVPNPSQVPSLGSRTLDNNDQMFFKVLFEGSLGADITRHLTETYTVQTGSELCAYVTNGIYACIPGSGSDTSCASSCPSGQSCQRIDSSRCGGLAQTYGCIAGGVYACSPTNKSDCSDLPSICTAGTCTLLQPSQCGQHVNVSGSVPIGQTKTEGISITNPLPSDIDSIIDLVDLISRWVFNLAIPVAVIIFIYGGILFLTAAGSEKMIGQGREAMKWGAIGLAIVLIGQGFVTLIKSILDLAG